MSTDNNNNGNENKISLSELDKWAEKWDIAKVQLKEAIERTDSLDKDTIEKWLIEHKYI